MFSALFQRAQATVDNAIGQAVNRLLIATPLAVAAAFATAGVYVRLEKAYGTEASLYILAAGFVLLGIVLAAVLGSKPTQTTSSSNAEEEAGEDAPALSSAEEEPMSKADRELMIAALTSAAPIALPTILRILMKNLPLIAVIVAAIVVLWGAPKAAEESPVSAT